MISFRNDYSEGAHPQVLAALEKNNLITTCGYSMDCFCDEAKDIVRARFSCPQADVHFMVGGTIANTTSMRRVRSKPPATRSAPLRRPTVS